MRLKQQQKIYWPLVLEKIGPISPSAITKILSLYCWSLYFASPHHHIVHLTSSVFVLLFFMKKIQEVVTQVPT